MQTINENVESFFNITDPQFIQQFQTHQLRKVCLEIIQKIPNGEHLRPYARSLLSLLFKIVEVCQPFFLKQF